MHRAANRLWQLTCRPEARRFQRELSRPEMAQAQTLSRFLRRAAVSEWGRAWQLTTDTSVDAFRQVVPLSDYDDYRDAIEQIDRFGTNPLTCEPVSLLEPTSGTSSGKKLIPYTPALKAEFQRALAVWIDDLFSRRPAVTRGPAYWAISPPALSRTQTASGIPIGFDDDTAYLGLLARLLAKRMLAVPPSVARLPHADDWQYLTMWYLLQTPNLALISVWSPTFLLEFTRRLEGPWRTLLARDLCEGRARLPSGVRIPEGPPVASMSGSARRAAQWLEADTSIAELTRQLWPSLAGVSCWTDGASQRYVAELQQAFPHAEVLPKGLLSTEGCVSIPLLDQPGGVLALRSHFFEFLPEGHAGETLLAHQLSQGHQYQVVITTGGGLYRYRTGDWVEVSGQVQRCPLIRFVGREATTDLVGEKLSDRFVQTVLDCLLKQQTCAASFALLVPDPDARCYRLFAEVPGNQQPPDTAVLSRRLDQLLSDNPYYLQARQLGQLNAACAEFDASGAGSFQQHFRQATASLQIRPGSLKATALETHPQRAAEFLQRCQQTCEHKPPPAAKH